MLGGGAMVTTRDGRRVQGMPDCSDDDDALVVVQLLRVAFNIIMVME
jgi:hypothetical protein